ncbi:MAG: YegS/Rv2252/BmrU family lipid kinase [Saprospiraceae bacterium]
MNIKEIVFLINPNSGKRKPNKILKKLISINPEFNIVVTKSTGEFVTFMNENIDRFKCFVVAGGDGTVNKCVDFLFGRDDKILAVIPIGSGNGFARETGFNTGLEKLIKNLEVGDYFKVDVMELNENKFINVAGFGFDAWVAHSFANRKSRGFINYFFATLTSFKEFKLQKTTLNISDKIYEDFYTMVVFANTRQFGNNAFIAPDANPESGLIEVVMVKKIPFYIYPSLIVNMFLGKKNNSEFVDYYRADSDIYISTDYNKFHFDGEPIELNENIIIKIYKKAVNVLKMN